jgi:positive regulator of sigma E activity
MIRTGKIEKIDENDIYVALLNNENSDDKSECGSGGCASCSKYAKKRLMKVSNPSEFPLTTGTIVQVNLAASTIVLAALRFFLLPLTMSAGGYFFMGPYRGGSESLALISGISGLVLGVLFNFVNRKKNRIAEMPEISGIL